MLSAFGPARPRGPVKPPQGRTPTTTRDQKQTTPTETGKEKTTPIETNTQTNTSTEPAP
jgi:hypothetical protein